MEAIMDLRNKTISFNIGNKKIGGENPILIQSMSDIRTSNIEANIKLTNSLTLYGLDMMRYSVLDLADAKALKIIKQNTKVPVIADIHFNAALAMECINSGVDKIRLNPGICL